MINRFFLLTFLFLFYYNSSSAQHLINKDSLLAHVQELSSDKYEGREVESTGNELARAYILQRFQDIGLKSFDSSYVHPFKFYSRFTRKTYQGKNLIGYVPGYKDADHFVVLSAHYDHVGIKKRKIYNGADDNASGVGTLIEIARHLTQYPLPYSVIIAAFDAEEIGLRGADAFVEDPPVKLDSILLNINMDMISRNKDNEIYICGTAYSPFLRPPLDSLAKEASIKVSFGHEAPESTGADDWTHASDHGKFHRKEIPFLYFGVEDHEDYHEPTDDFEKIMPDFYHQVSEFILRCLTALELNY